MLTTLDTNTLDNVTGGTVRSSSSDQLLTSLQTMLTQLQQNQNNNNGGLNNNTLLLMCMLALRPDPVVYVRRPWGWCG